MTPQTALIVGLLAPLVTALLVPMLAVRANWRDAVGPIGALVAFISALYVAAAVMQGEAPQLTILKIMPGLDLTFAVTPPGLCLGACFGAVDPRLALHNGLYARQSRKAPDTICHLSRLLCMPR